MFNLKNLLILTLLTFVSFQSLAECNGTFNTGTLNNIDISKDISKLLSEYEMLVYRQAQLVSALKTLEGVSTEFAESEKKRLKELIEEIDVGLRKLRLEIYEAYGLDFFLFSTIENGDSGDVNTKLKEQQEKSAYPTSEIEIFRVIDLKSMNFSRRGEIDLELLKKLGLYDVILKR